MITQGWDISLNHGAVVQLRDGYLDGFWFYTDLAGCAKKGKERGFRVPPSADKDRAQKQMLRLAWLENWMDKEILVKHPADFVAVEDYAIRAEQQAHYIGEVGGIARILLWFRGTAFRLHDPISAKMFVTHDGTAQKDLVEEAVLERWGADFSDFNMPKAPKAARQNRQTSEDLADAYALAKLCYTEARLRAGDITMKDLEHDKERQVFNRVTKTYPVSLLGREWIQNPRGTPTPHGRYPDCSSERCMLARMDEKGLLKPKTKKAIARLK